MASKPALVIIFLFFSLLEGEGEDLRNVSLDTTRNLLISVN